MIHHCRPGDFLIAINRGEGDRGDCVAVSATKAGAITAACPFLPLWPSLFPVPATATRLTLLPRGAVLDPS